MADDARLISALETLIGNLFAGFIRAAGAHWNVTGENFPALHAFFGALYEDWYGSIDPFAEALRQHRYFAPCSLREVGELADMADKSALKGDPKSYLDALLLANGTIMENLKAVRVQADNVGDEGLANFCQERLAKHLKWDWQMRVTAKG